MVLVSAISNFFTNKTSLANKWMSFSSSNLALCIIIQETWSLGPFANYVLFIYIDSLGTILYYKKTCLNSRILSMYLPLRLPISPWWPTLHRHQWVYLGGQWLPVWLKSFISGNVLLLNLFFLGMIAKILLELSCVFVPMVFANWVPLMNVKI